MPTKREMLPDDRTGFNHRFSLPYKREYDRFCPECSCAACKSLQAEAAQPERMKLYFNVGLYPDGRPGEVFIRADRSGSLASGALDAVAMMMSIALQYGVPVRTLIDKLRHSRFDPQGTTRNSQFPSASSPLDLLAQWLHSKWPGLDGT